MGALWSYRPSGSASCIEIGRLEATAPISQAAHFHSEIQVASITHGCRVYSSPFGELCAHAGDMVIIPAHLPHASRSPGSSKSVVIHLYLSSDRPSVRGLVVPQIIRGVYAQSPGEMLDAAGSVRRGEPQDRQFGEPGALWKPVVDQQLDIKSIAAQLGYSTDGFIRAFRRQLGMTPAAYRLAHRLMKARSELRNGNTVADVAFAASFTDQSHFGRLFRRAYGATPSRYRSAFAVP